MVSYLEEITLSRCSVDDRSRVSLSHTHTPYLPRMLGCHLVQRKSYFQNDSVASPKGLIYLPGRWSISSHCRANRINNSGVLIGFPFLFQRPCRSHPMIINRECCELCYLQCRGTQENLCWKSVGEYSRRL